MQPLSSVGRVLPGLLLAMLLGALDQTIMTPALPAVAEDLGRLDQMPAVVISYLAAATAVMPLYGKLGDRFGRKRTMLVAVAVFVVGATLCATATSMALLTVFRAVQGLGGGGLMVGPQAVIGEIVSPRERGRYLGYIGAAYVVAAVGGPVLGGLIVEGLGWRWIFALYPPLGAVAFTLLALTLRLPRPPERPPIDYAGALTLAAAVIGVVLFGQTRHPTWLILTVVAAAAWLISSRFAADPHPAIAVVSRPRLRDSGGDQLPGRFRAVRHTDLSACIPAGRSRALGKQRRSGGDRTDGRRSDHHGAVRPAHHTHRPLQGLSGDRCRGRRSRVGAAGDLGCGQRPRCDHRDHGADRVGRRTDHAGHGAGCSELSRL
jgi:Major Facilitator Superfamily